MGYSEDATRDVIVYLVYGERGDDLPHLDAAGQSKRNHLVSHY